MGAKSAAVRYGCNILHGPNVSNFSRYITLKRNKIAIRVNKKENIFIC